MPAYIIFGDAALRDWIRKRLSAAGVLFAVSGMRTRKLEQY
jgi:hypothetical protein